MEKHLRLTIVIGVLLGVFITLNFLLAFGKIPGSGVGLITGTAGSVPAACQEIIGGVKCEDAFYPLKTEESCADGTVQTCTNACQIEGILQQDDRVCPVYCSDFCLLPELADKLK